MKLIESTDTASKIGEVIGKVTAIFIIGMIAYVALTYGLRL